MRRLTNRAQFVRAARGLKINGRFFALQKCANDRDDAGIGFTVTKRTGNAPVRNRIKRRLKAVVQDCASAFDPQYDYVLIGRPDAIGADFETMKTALRDRLAKAKGTDDGASISRVSSPSLFNA